MTQRPAGAAGPRKPAAVGAAEPQNSSSNEAAEYQQEAPAEADPGGPKTRAESRVQQHSMTRKVFDHADPGSQDNRTYLKHDHLPAQGTERSKKRVTGCKGGQLK